eukprot:Blabericola_migrator_1__10697@NODE_610_length_7290_cov_63_426554_g443_i0_p2_GENE_NODE_610_length_7290_cov_63_426554_g443_i0NODE_610_length_7290_cov_63_426554_g443_i0_p2_ORF_typecomplete_len514_score91_36Methyltr_RsmBF/PF01189_17/2_4e12Methyltr_RsmBF/PF01189_17/1_4e20GCD14/PF08704_10/0_00031RrnaAD/PF00398_20/0_0004PCMT/PF01135_19/0_0069Methyltransf_3/PF01596_17/0_02FtsJ/PF01728_19/0_027Ubie_methyltran/PF01209_18/0_061_NODE_610_length_7290_cov_63_426554_g443_i033884929
MDTRTAEILLTVANGRSIKSAAYNSPYKNDKRLPSMLALAQKCVDNYAVLRKALIETALIDEKQLPENMIEEKGVIRKRRKFKKQRVDLNALAMMVNLCDYFTNRRSPSTVKKKFEPHAEILNTFKNQIVVRQKPKAGEGEPSPTQPRHIRIDLSRLSRDAAINIIKEELTDVSVEIDEVLDNVISLNGLRLEQRLLNLPAVQNGSIVMMDRGTCFSAAAMELEAGDIVLDICAAPGSKTLAFLSALREKGCVISVEKDEERFYAMLQRISKESPLTNIELVSLLSPSKKKSVPVVLQDYKSWKDLVPNRYGVMFSSSSDDRSGLLAIALLTDFFSLNSCDPASCTCVATMCLQRMLQYCRAKIGTDERPVKISLDPSCSGSGLPQHSAHDALQNAIEHKDKHLAMRLASLASFQVLLLQAALSLRLPVSIALYSTCSVYEDENEDVIQKTLNAHGIDWQVVQAYPESWKAFAKPIEKSVPSWWSLCLRTDPTVHKCRGFFLAKLKPIKNQNI